MPADALICKNFFNIYKLMRFEAEIEILLYDRFNLLLWTKIWNLMKKIWVLKRSDATDTPIGYGIYLFGSLSELYNLGRERLIKVSWICKTNRCIETGLYVQTGFLYMQTGLYLLTGLHVQTSLYHVCTYKQVCMCNRSVGTNRSVLTNRSTVWKTIKMQEEIIYTYDWRGNWINKIEDVTFKIILY